MMSTQGSKANYRYGIHVTSFILKYVLKKYKIFLIYFLDIEQSVMYIVSNEGVLLLVGRGLWLAKHR